MNEVISMIVTGLIAVGAMTMTMVCGYQAATHGPMSIVGAFGWGVTALGNAGLATLYGVEWRQWERFKALAALNAAHQAQKQEKKA